MKDTYEFAENIQRGILYLSKSELGFLLQVLPMVKPEYFEYPSHQKIYTIITEHYYKYKKLPSDDVILEEAKKVKSSNELFSDYKEELTQVNCIDEAALGNCEYYLDLVEEFAREAALKEAILDSVDLIKTKEFGQIESKIREAVTVNRNVELGSNYFSGVKDRWQRLADIKSTPRFKTPFPSVNTSLEGGLNSKELAMVVAPPGVGKSMFLANQAVSSSLDGHKVLYISLEMSEDKVAQRLDSIFSRIRQSDLTNKLELLEERLDMLSSIHKVGKIWIKEFPTKRASINSIRAYLNQLRNYEEFVPDVIVIDYLELMTGDTSMPEYQLQERLAQELRGLATEYDLLVWTATQTNREGKKVPIITDAELADSYGKMRVCDLVFSINQTENEFDEGKARLYVMKSRNGKGRFIVPVKVDYNKLTITQENANTEN
jgi:replicative DNA helicase